MKTIKVLLLIMFVAMQASAQKDSVKVKRMAISLIASEGCLCGIPNDDLNAILKNNDFPAISKNMLAATAGFGFSIDRLSFQALFKNYTMSKQSNSFFSGTGHGMGTEFRLQYNVMKPGKTYFSPYAGFGRQSFEFRFDSQNPRDLNSAIQTFILPQKSYKINSDESVGTVGVAVGLSKRTAAIGYKLGLSAGYQFAFNGQWRMNEELVQKPDSSFSGFEAKIDIAFFYEFKR